LSHQTLTFFLKVKVLAIFQWKRSDQTLIFIQQGEVLAIFCSVFGHLSHLVKDCDLILQGNGVIYVVMRFTFLIF